MHLSSGKSYIFRIFGGNKAISHIYHGKYLQSRTRLSR